MADRAAGRAGGQPLRRRDAAALVAAAALRPWPARAAAVLRVLSWPGYADADFVAAFEKRTGAKVEITTVASDDMLRAELADATGPGFDVIAANTAEIARLLARQQLAPLPLRSIRHAQHQLPRFRDLSAIVGITQGAAAYAMPFTYSEMGLIYDRRQFARPPRSLAVLWDARWQGRVLAYDGSTHGFSLAAMHRGMSPFRIADGGFKTLTQDLVDLRRNLRAFYRLPEEALELFRQQRIAAMHANYGRQQFKQLRDAGLDVGYVVPREGALAWLDCWAITRRCAQVALAAAWIDHMLTPEISREFTRRQGLANTLDEPAALAGDALAGPIVWLEPVEDEIRRDRLWQRIVSGDRFV
ncbi:MAG: extracellular solute-binding protein [Acidovorax sp.]